MRITSSSFKDGAPIPRRHTEDGDDLSPSLSWTEVPEGTAELALIVDDPDAPRDEPWVHWLVYAIPRDQDGLGEGVPHGEGQGSPPGLRQGRNSFPGENIGYRGPAPPEGHGPHHYHFRLYAVDEPIGTPAGADRRALERALEGHVLATAQLTGVYER